MRFATMGRPMLPSPTNAIDFMHRLPAPQMTAPQGARRRPGAAPSCAPSWPVYNRQSKPTTGHCASIVRRSHTACYNPAPIMLLRDWVLLVVGTALGVVSLTADLLGLGAFRGFGWKQILGTVVALGLVATTA